MQARAEILKLAQLLRRDPRGLAHLERADPGDLRRLREQVTDLLFDDQGPVLGRLAAASRLLPIRLVAIIGERAFGPLLAARIAGLLDPARAAEMAATMPIEFLTDVALELDPRRASAVIGRISPSRIALITQELLRRREYVAMGRFVGHLAEPALRAAVSVMDDRELLEVSYIIETGDGLGAVIDLLAPERLAALIDAAARGGTWLELLALVSLVATPSQRRIAEAVARLDPAERDVLEREARAAGLTEAVELLDRAQERS